MRSLWQVLRIWVAGFVAVEGLILGCEFSAGPFTYTNIARDMRAWVLPTNTSQPSPVDSNGWPMSDIMSVIFDYRPAFAWAPPEDDPWGWQPNVSGTYSFNFSGAGTVFPNNDPGMEGGMTVSNVTFDPISFSTAGFFTIKAGTPALAEIIINATRRSATSPLGSGFTNLVILRPGHAADPDMTLSPELITALAPFAHFRFMGISGTNENPGYYGDAGHHYLDFNQRCLPTDALIPNSLRPGCWGIPWEMTIQASQATSRGIWVNAPVSATVSWPANETSYVYEWATLLRDGNAATGNKGVPAGAPIYIEHSNEVWNYGFGQYVWNKLAAQDECTLPSTCDWNNDGETDPDIWQQRRHIAKAAQIGQNFVEVFGAGSFLTQIRPIWADVWMGFPNHNMSATLEWFNKTYGPPSKFFYGMSVAGYFGGNAVANMTIDEIYADYKNASDQLLPVREAMVALASSWGLKHTSYEAGPGWNVGTENSMSNYIIAQRLAPMRQVWTYDVKSSWEVAGGDIYNQFSLFSSYSRYGMWGAAENFFNVSTPKYCAAMDVVGAPAPPPGCAGW